MFPQLHSIFRQVLEALACMPLKEIAGLALQGLIIFLNLGIQFVTDCLPIINVLTAKKFVYPCLLTKACSSDCRFLDYRIIPFSPVEELHLK